MASEFLDTCDCNTLVTGAKCLREPAVSATLRKAVQIVLLNYIQAATNGVGATFLTTQELVQAGKCWENVSQQDKDAAWTYELQQLAEAVSVTVPNTGSLIDQACKLQCGTADLDSIMSAVLCLFIQGFKNRYDMGVI